MKTKEARLPTFSTYMCVRIHPIYIYIDVYVHIHTHIIYIYIYRYTYRGTIYFYRQLRLRGVASL